MVLVSSPPIVCRTSTPSRLSCSAATCSGSCPGWTRPRLTQSSTLVSLTRLLPIGLPPNACSRCGVRPHLVGHLDGLAGEQAGVAVAVGDDPHVGRDLGVALDQAADGGGEAGREAAGGEHGNGGDGHRQRISGLVGLVHRVLQQLGADPDGARGDGGFDQEDGKAGADRQHRGDEQPGDLGAEPGADRGWRRTAGRRPGRSGSPR